MKKYFLDQNIKKIEMQTEAQVPCPYGCWYVLSLILVIDSHYATGDGLYRSSQPVRVVFLHVPVWMLSFYWRHSSLASNSSFPWRLFRCQFVRSFPTFSKFYMSEWSLKLMYYLDHPRWSWMCVCCVIKMNKCSDDVTDTSAIFITLLSILLDSCLFHNDWFICPKGCWPSLSWTFCLSCSLLCTSNSCTCDDEVAGLCSAYVLYMSVHWCPHFRSCFLYSAVTVHSCIVYMLPSCRLETRTTGCHRMGLPYCRTRYYWILLILHRHNLNFYLTIGK